MNRAPNLVLIRHAVLAYVPSRLPVLDSLGTRSCVSWREVLRRKISTVNLRWFVR